MEEMKLFVKIALHRMYDHYLPKLLRSIQTLNMEQLWECNAPGLNSVGGIVLHICEHIKRNTLSYLQRNIKFDEGIEEYFPQLDFTPDMLSIIVQETFDKWKHQITNMINENNYIDIDMHSLFHLVEHTSYHLGQIVDRAKRMTGTSFQFCQNGLNEKTLRLIIESEKF
jgi:uncharacterized damage-inducible protein DinB